MNPALQRLAKKREEEATTKLEKIQAGLVDSVREILAKPVVAEPKRKPTLEEIDAAMRLMGYKEGVARTNEINSRAMAPQKVAHRPLYVERPEEKITGDTIVYVPRERRPSRLSPEQQKIARRGFRIG